MSEAIKIMDDIETDSAEAMHGPFVSVEPAKWISLRTAVEAQAEELAQSRAKAEYAPDEVAAVDANGVPLEKARLHREWKEQRARIARLESELMTCRDAIAALPQDVFGTEPESHDCPAYPIRDEILHRISHKLRESPAQSLASIQAEALLDLLEALDPKTESQCEMIADIGRYIDRTEQENAKRQGGGDV